MRKVFFFFCDLGSEAGACEVVHGMQCFGISMVRQSKVEVVR